MTYRRNINFLVFILASLAIHAAVLSMVASPIWNRLFGGRIAPKQSEVTVALVPPADEEPDMGEANAKGIGSNKSEGEQPLLAREAEEDQAFLSRDPRGPGRVGNEPAMNTGPLGEGGSGGQTASEPNSAMQSALAAALAPSPTAKAMAQPIKIEPASPPLLQASAQSKDGGIPVASAAVAIPKVDPIKISPAVPQPAVATAAPVPPHPATGDARAPGAPAPQADPAQQSVSESDPFARVGSVVWRDGKLDIQLGRQVHTTRPRILLAGKVDLLSMDTASVVLKISIDKAGKVTNVGVVRSSGTVDIDQPCQVAVYDWWFEPTRTKAGNPIPDTLLLTIRFE